MKQAPRMSAVKQPPQPQPPPLPLPPNSHCKVSTEMTPFQKSLIYLRQGVSLFGGPRVIKLRLRDLNLQGFDFAFVTLGLVDFRLTVGCFRRWRRSILDQACIGFVVALHSFFFACHTSAEVDNLFLIVILVTHGKKVLWARRARLDAPI